MPTGKQNSIAKIEIMKVRARPPHSLVGIFSKLKFPPDRRDIKIKGKTNSKKIIIYFFILFGTKNAAATVKINIIKAKFIRHI